MAYEKKPGYVVLYPTMFPQLISGPITRFSRIRARLAERVQQENFSAGHGNLSGGAGLYVLLANRFGGLWKNIEGSVMNLFLYLWHGWGLWHTVPDLF